MIKINNLNVELKSNNDTFYILRDFSIDLRPGEILGLAGESGSGKSVLAKTILGINKSPIYKTSGDIFVENKKIVSLKDYRTLRGKKISMIFQNPQSSLNPVMTIGEQLIETIRLHNKEVSKKEAKIRAINLLEDVEINNAEDRLDSYPHQLSGGMNQRVMIAMCLASDPDIIIADEPTTALDVTIQAQIINLIKDINKKRNLTILFISHDLALLSTICSRVAVIYSGELMEIINASDLKTGNELHPYTHALKNCIPTIGNKKELVSIKGIIEKNNSEYSNKCIFANRCTFSSDKCFNEKPSFNNNIKCFNSLKTK